MRKIFTGGVMAILVILLSAGLALAGGYNSGRRGNGGVSQDRKRDGSCATSYILNQERQKLPALAKTQQRDRKKDNSCKS